MRNDGPLLHCVAAPSFCYFVAASQETCLVATLDVINYAPLPLCCVKWARNAVNRKQIGGSTAADCFIQPFEQQSHLIRIKWQFQILLNFEMNCITLTTTTHLFSKSEAIWPSNRSATWTNREICSFNGRVSFQWNFVSTRNTRVVGKRSTLWPVHYQHLCWHFEYTFSCIHSNLNLCKCPVKLVTDAADISLCLTHVQLLLHWRMRGMWCSY